MAGFGLPPEKSNYAQRLLKNRGMIPCPITMNRRKARSARRSFGRCTPWSSFPVPETSNITPPWGDKSPRCEIESRQNSLPTSIREWCMRPSDGGFR